MWGRIARAWNMSFILHGPLEQIGTHSFILYNFMPNLGNLGGVTLPALCTRVDIHPQE